ncbi:hypothetical protein EN833_23350 [Mesorhizobium sp. M4B.F.Ca.ET.190.01.1.1]|uniref:HK97 family phage prohead protease n=1 Tax=unclassified Mesorhizobium TaxID=325217 RepID=UPI001092DACE|nr:MULTISPECIES: HK97 family phage prohead protease [unclassified Mesorhizobium]TGR05411.1 hypothetical protein EN843_23340 [Mesorhizobium sp. M4B.F.Ca.ET.200.01.1.1]TGS15667.1 hypothetical protein EN833_23350 [Mesorhizobium sp. M4B.F.Ca.ET.190.01.1.1]TGT27727.1 hypothetical protein EN815_23325 [Mesorhizobium sp. M4B.F.Ca.ET.172.01.1.1]
MLHRAVTLFEIKSADDEKRTIRGVATTVSVDRQGDIVVPEGAVFSLPLPLLWQHDAKSPIGHVTKAKVTKAGIEIVAEIAKGVTDEIDKAWALIKAGLVRGLSIGFQPLESEPISGTYGRRFTKWSWMELSAVTIAANEQASIQTIKLADAKVLKRLEVEHATPSRSAKRSSAKIQKVQEENARQEDGERFVQEVKEVSELLTRTHGFADVTKPLSTRMTFWMLAEFHVLAREKYRQIDARFAELEDGIVSGVKYAGTWQRQLTYAVGSLVTRSGGLWHANVESTGHEPGDGAAWTLCAKSGSDIPKTRKQMQEEAR